MNIGSGMCRKSQYELLKRAIKKVLEEYCSDKINLGWSSQAKGFLDEIESWPLPSFDKPLFLKLHTRASEFSQSLVSMGSYFASFFVSQEILGSYGCGSSLKERIENVLSAFDPYSFKWINYEIFEIKINRNVEHILYKTPLHHSNYYSDLSSESKRVFRQALQDDALMNALKRGADINYLPPSLDELVEAAKCAESMNLGLTESHKLK